jgi:DNA polymerase-1
MELEGTWDIYQQVERSPAYLNALRFVQGTPISLQKMNELRELDDKEHAAAWAKFRDFLISRGWAGTVCPEFKSADQLTAAAIKEAFLIVAGEELKTQVRTPAKLVALIREQEVASAWLLAECLASALGGDCTCLNDLIKLNFKGEPEFNFGSPVQIGRLLYETLGLPVRLRNPITAAARAKGATEGGARTDAAAFEFALAYDTDKGPEVLEILKALQVIKMVDTRRKLYYVPYRNVQHWKDSLVHSHLNQCQTVTRRYSESDPNKQQLPKHPKYGRPARFREVYVPHKPGAVIVSLDFKAQELVLIADESQDENMLACFVGPELKDMHSITGIGIMKKKTPEQLARMIGINPQDPAFNEAANRWRAYDYARFFAGVDDKSNPDNQLIKLLRAAGKKTNFTTEYGAQAPKLSETLVVPIEEAREYIAAKEAAFPRAVQWKKEVIARARNRGYSLTKMGARRHLPDLLSDNKFDQGAAERQAVNFEVQGSCAEQTKLVEARLWDLGVFFRYDARYIGPVHDELVFSVMADELIEFLKDVHALMTQPYANMKLPVVSSISFGPNYGEQIECGEEVDAAAVLKAFRATKGPKGQEVPVFPPETLRLVEELEAA